MSELRWSEEGAPLPPKKKVPTWLWWVGGGCLLLLLAAGACSVLAVRMFQKARDPEVQWAEVARILPYDERPEGASLEWGSQIGMDMYVFMVSDGYIAMLMRTPAGDDSDRKKLMDEHESFQVFGKGGRHEAVKGTILVQGRELPALRFVQEQAQQSSGPQVGSGGSVLVDLTPEGEERALLLQFTRADGRDEPIPDEAVVRFLKPFHVGSER